MAGRCASQLISTSGPTFGASIVVSLRGAGSDESLRIRHSTTGEIYEIESDELDWDAVGGDERQMGPEIHYEATIEHPELDELTWGLWEYPVGIENNHETNAGPHHVIADFDYGLEHGEPEPDEWLDYTVPDNPFTIFMSSYHHNGDLLVDQGKDSGDHLLNRMVFSHQVTALEAYLGDTLMNEVMVDNAAMQRLIDRDDVSRRRGSPSLISPRMLGWSNAGSRSTCVPSCTTTSRRSTSSITLFSDSAS